MGVGVSGWKLARAISKLGQLGVVSGTGLSVVLARRLSSGDVGGHMRRALAHFPVSAMAERVLTRYYIAGGKPKSEPYRGVPAPTIDSPAALIELTVVANFAEVWLAKEGHDGVVGINYLEKLQIPTLSSLLGAMLAGVDYVLMGAGIPRSIPGVLDAFTAGRAAELRVDVDGALPDDNYSCRLDPAELLGFTPELRRPKFLAIISSVVLAMTLARKSNGHVDGFVIEGATAGGHNAPPRGTLSLTAAGEPAYSVRDAVDLEKIRELGVPFWLAGGFGQPDRLKDALAVGAQGIQVGTAFAFCDESSITDDLKHKTVHLSRAGRARVFADPKASPTGFPFKVVAIDGTLSNADAYVQRERVCDVGHLRRPYRRADGTVGYRCPAEQVEAYVAQGGRADETYARICLCNALFATIGLEQTLPNGKAELPVVTAGNDVSMVSSWTKPGHDTYAARDVLESLLAV
ncbi:nitronate monooxygenase [soil metagenome]